MEIVIMVIAGFLLDCLIGDPRQIPHPIRFIGLLIDRGRKRRSGRYSQRAKTGETAGGIFLNLIVLAASFFIPFFLLKGLYHIHPWLGFAVETFFCCQIFCGQITEAGEHAGIWLR